MISRRALLATWLGAYALAQVPSFAIGRKPKVQAAPVLGGPRTLARQEWPPAITPEYVGIVDKGYACFADDMGRLAIVDLKREDNPQVMGELFGIGRKVVALAITQHRAIAVAQVDSGTDVQFQLVIASLTPANDISIMSKTVLSNFAEPCSVASFGDVIAIGGTGLNNENQIVFYSIGKKKTVEPVQISALTIEHNPFKMDFQDRQLLALCGIDSTDLVSVNLANPRAPELQGSVRLDGSFQSVARIRDQILVAGYGFDHKCQCKLITMKPTMSVATTVALSAVTEILDLAAQRTQFLLLVNQGERQAVVPVILGRKNTMTAGATVPLPAGARGSSPRAHIAVKEKDAYVATDWGGVQVLNIAKNGWQLSYANTIPRLPASALVLSGTNAVIACAELKLYDLKDPHHPELKSSTDISSTVRSMLSLGRTFLCLTKDSLTIRSADKPSEIIANAKTSGNSLAYDESKNIAYVLKSTDKGCQLNVFKAAEDSLKFLVTRDIPSPGRKAIAQQGLLLLAGLNELNLYKTDDSNTVLVASRKIPNFAIRDFVIAGNNIFVSCVDENLKGTLLALSADKDDLAIAGACELPVDASALAVSGNKAVVLGRAKDGKDSVALVSVGNPAQMRVLESFATLEAASAVVIQNSTAIVAGRGLEILNIS